MLKHVKYITKFTILKYPIQFVQPLQYNTNITILLFQKFFPITLKGKFVSIK